MTKREDFLKEQLSQFVTKHASDVSLGGIDEIVLSYLVSILEQLGCESSPEDLFDVDEFTEMMEAYLPGFGDINSIKVSEWMFDLTNKLKDLDNEVTNNSSTPVNCPALVSMTATSITPLSTSRSISESSPFVLPETRNSQNPFKDLLTRPLSLPNGDLDSSSLPHLPSDSRSRTQSLSDNEPVTQSGGSKGQRSRTVSTSSSSYGSDRKRTQSTSSNASSNGFMMSEDGVTCDFTDFTDVNSNTTETDTLQMLLEMFPKACTMEVNHCLTVAKGDMETAAQLLITRQEAGQSITEPSSSKKKGRKAGSKKASVSILNDPRMKETIINKYSYVDVDSECKEHRPAAPKTSDKKMIRYLDGKIVSTKGERFTEIKKDDDEKMKKTYVNLKPAKQYRFH